MREPINKKKSKWAEVVCDYLDEENSVWTVDAWMSDDPNAEGSVIAYIDDLTGRVFYCDLDARWDWYAQDIIAEKLKELAPRVAGWKKRLGAD